MPVQIPFPTTLIHLTWACIGFMFARAFGKQIDQDIQNGDWFKSLPPAWQSIVKRLLDFLHHFYIGLLLMISYKIDEVFFWGVTPVSLYWFGWGLFIDDIPDIPQRLLRYFEYLNGDE